MGYPSVHCNRPWNHVLYSIGIIISSLLCDNPISSQILINLFRVHLLRTLQRYVARCCGCEAFLHRLMQCQLQEAVDHDDVKAAQWVIQENPMLLREKVCGRRALEKAIMVDSMQVAQMMLLWEDKREISQCLKNCKSVKAATMLLDHGADPTMMGLDGLNQLDHLVIWYNALTNNITTSSSSGGHLEEDSKEFDKMLAYFMELDLFPTSRALHTLRRQQRWDQIQKLSETARRIQNKRRHVISLTLLRCSPSILSIQENIFEFLWNKNLFYESKPGSLKNSLKIPHQFMESTMTTNDAITKKETT